MSKILQIIPATGWLAAHKDEGSTTGLYIEPLMCFALVEGEDGDREVVGLAGWEWADNVEHSGSFFGYFTNQADAASTFAACMQTCDRHHKNGDKASYLENGCLQLETGEEQGMQTLEQLKQAYVEAKAQADQAQDRERAAQERYKAAFRQHIAATAGSQPARETVRAAIEFMLTQGTVLYTSGSIANLVATPLRPDPGAISGALEELADETPNIIKRDFRVGCCCGNPIVGLIDSKDEVERIKREGVYCGQCDETIGVEDEDFTRFYVHVSAR